jgi:membrane protease YdiL (CAAX protease family)
VVTAFVVVIFVVPALTLKVLDAVGFYQQVYGPDFPRMPEKSRALEEGAAVAGVPAVVAAQRGDEIRAQIRGLWAHAVALPIQLGILVAGARWLYPRWRPQLAGGFARNVALAVAAWAVLTPLTLAVNLAVNFLLLVLDVEPDAHPLTRLADRPALDSAMFLFQATVVGPIVEEVVFRGLILVWVFGGWTRTSTDLPSRRRSWIVMIAGVAFAVFLSGAVGPIAFAAILAAGLAGVRLLFQSKRRAASAVYSSAAFFAAVHSSVWPSPIPLFLLGLGLGWLALRTRGLLAPILVHGLFNAVSAVMVLRGGAG